MLRGQQQLQYSDIHSFLCTHLLPHQYKLQPNKQRQTCGKLKHAHNECLFIGLGCTQAFWDGGDLSVGEFQALTGNVVQVTLRTDGYINSDNHHTQNYFDQIRNTHVESYQGIGLVYTDDNDINQKFSINVRL